VRVFRVMVGGAHEQIVMSLTSKLPPTLRYPRDGGFPLARRVNDTPRVTRTLGAISHKGISMLFRGYWQVERWVNRPSLPFLDLGLPGDRRLGTLLHCPLIRRLAVP